MKHIKKFNENDEFFHLDDEGKSYYKESKNRIKNTFEDFFDEISAEMDEYTTGAEGEINLKGMINNYEYSVNIKRVK